MRGCFLIGCFSFFEVVSGGEMMSLVLEVLVLALVLEILVLERVPLEIGPSEMIGIRAQEMVVLESGKKGTIEIAALGSLVLEMAALETGKREMIEIEHFRNHNNRNRKLIGLLC
jgi:hypothetical protein